MIANFFKTIFGVKTVEETDGAAACPHCVRPLSDIGVISENGVDVHICPHCKNFINGDMAAA